MLEFLIGSFPALSASSPSSLPLRSMPAHHALHALQIKIQATLTPSVNNAGPLISSDIDNMIAIIVTNVRLYGGAIGEPINISNVHLRSIYILRALQDIKAVVPATNTALIGATLTSGTGYVCNFDLSIPFFDRRALLDPDWCAPCTDTFRHEAFLEVTAGTLAATTGFTGTSTITPSVISVELVANMTDAHGSFLAPVTAMRTLTQANNTQSLEPGLYVNLFDTRNVMGAVPSAAYNPTYAVFKDGKPIIQNTTGQSLAYSWYKHVSAQGGFDAPARVGPIVFLNNGYSEEDLKPSLASHVVNIPTGFTAGTFVYDLLRAVTADQEQRQAQNEGMAKYNAPLRPVLGSSDGSNDHEKIALFKPRWILRAA